MDYDKVWVNRGHTKNMKKVNTTLSKIYWSTVKVDDGLFEELEEVVSAFWVLLMK